MKKMFLLLFVAASALVLGGCQSTNNQNTDDAESAIIPEGVAQDAVNTPPSPPEPTRPVGE